MTIKLTRPQADAIKAIVNGMNRSPPLRRDVMDGLEKHGFVRRVSHPAIREIRYELTEEGQRFAPNRFKNTGKN